MNCQSARYQSNSWQALLLLLVFGLAIQPSCVDAFLTTGGTTASFRRCSLPAARSNRLMICFTQHRDSDDHDTNDNENDDDTPASLEDLLDQPFFDPTQFEENDTSPLGWFANLVKSDYELAETLYVGTIFVLLIILSQELLRWQLYGDSYVPFVKGGGATSGKLF